MKVETTAVRDRTIYTLNAMNIHWSLFYRNWVFTGSKDGEVKAWSLNSLSCRHSFKLRYGSVFSVNFTLTGKDDEEIVQYILAGCTNCSLVRIPFHQRQARIS